MSSHSAPDSPRQNSTADVSTSVAIFRYIANASGQHSLPQDLYHTLYDCLLQLIKHLVPGIQSLDSASHQDVYTSEPFLQFLNVITELGHCAESDLDKCKTLQHCESKVYGFTGSVIDLDQEQMESSQDVTVSSAQLLPLDDRWEVLCKSVHSCMDQMQQLKNLLLTKLLQEYTTAVKSLKSNRFAGGQVEAFMQESLTQHQQMEIQVETLRTQIKQEIEGTSWSHLSACRESLCDVMKKWRNTDAWIYAQIIAVSQHHIEELLCDLKLMFQQYFDVLTNLARLNDEVEDSVGMTIRERLHDISNQLYSVGWCIEQNPHLSVLDMDKMNLSVRLFGLQRGDIHGIDLYVFPQCDYNDRHNTKYLCTGTNLDVQDSHIKGTCVKVKDFRLKKCPRAQKRGSAMCCEQFYRVCFVVRLKSAARQNVECLSAPFTIRTGSVQLWECEGLVKCYCFTAVDLYTPPFQCQPEMSIQELLTMLQAMITTADPDKKLDCDEIWALTDMLRTLTGTDRVSLKKFVKDHMPKQGRDKTGQNCFSCFNWFVAALNTHMFLKQYTHLRGCSDFTGFDQAKAKDRHMPTGSAWIRISRNEIETTSGKTPYAHVVVHINTPTKVQSCIVSHTELTIRSLSSYLRCVTDSHGNRLVLSILPHGIPVEKMDDNSAEHQQVDVNGYRTATLTFKQERILGAGFEKMHFNDNRDRNLPDNDRSSQAAAKRTRIQTCTSSTAPGSQTGLPSTAADLSFPEIVCSDELSPDNHELRASISPLPDEQLQKYLKTMTPVHPSQENLDKLLKICLGVEVDSS